MNKKVISYGLSAIVVFSVIAMVMPLSAQIQMADEFGVEDAMGNPNTYVKVPVNITNVQNGPIASIIFDILYNGSVLSVAGVEKGDLISQWAALTYNDIEAGHTRVTASYDGVVAHAIQNTSTGSVVLLNFSVIGVPGASSMMNLSNIQFANTRYEMGTAPAKDGTFRVDAGAPIVINPNANPDTIMADGTQESQLNVTVSEDIAVDEIVVTINVTQIGGPAEKVMEMIDDMLFSTTTNASIGTTPKTYYLPINATDLLGNYNNTVNITLNVTSPGEGSITGKITYTCNETGIPGVNVNLTRESVVASTTTDSNGNYTFANVSAGDYYVNASKPRVEHVTGFWDNSTNVTLSAGETKEVNMMLWLKGDLNNNGISADAVDLLMMIDASVGKITPDWRYDLNHNGIPADAVDLLMMIDASVGKIVLEDC